jgi:hypothetical protein
MISLLIQEKGHLFASGFGGGTLAKRLLGSLLRFNFTPLNVQKSLMSFQQSAKMIFSTRPGNQNAPLGSVARQGVVESITLLLMKLALLDDSDKKILVTLKQGLFRYTSEITVWILLHCLIGNQYLGKGLTGLGDGVE